jgi:hypothetical protein
MVRVWARAPLAEVQAEVPVRSLHGVVIVAGEVVVVAAGMFPPPPLFEFRMWMIDF